MATIDLDLFAQMNEDPKATGQDLVEYVRYSLDLGHVSFAVLRSPGSVVHQNNYGFSTYPSEWIQHYAKNQFWRIDPAVVLGLKRVEAFDWSEAELDLKLKRFWVAAKKFGIEPQGFTVPLHGPNREACILSISPKHEMDKDDWRQATRTKMIRDLLPIAHTVQRRAFKDLGFTDYSSPFMHLTAPKREILYCAACGKTANETAIIMDISERAVREHREGILKQMNCVSITQAVAEAL